MAKTEGFNIVDPDTGEILNHKGRRLDHIGREIPDPTPLPPPPGYKDGPDIFEIIRTQVANHLRAQSEAAEEPETEEEANDFDTSEYGDYDFEFDEGDFDVNLARLKADVEARKSGQDGEKLPTINVSATPIDTSTSDSEDK